MNWLKRFRSYPLYVFLLPVFFVAHGFTSNFYFVSITSAFNLVILYSLWALVITAIIFLFCRKLQLSAFMTFFIMSANFFFGYLQDLANKYVELPIFLKRYSVIAFVLFGLMIAAYFFFRKKNLEKLTYYLNTLFTIFIIIEIVTLTTHLFLKNKEPEMVTGITPIAKSVEKPDIYIIVLDGYAGFDQLNDVFKYDNHPFADSLVRLGFYTVKKSSSNYDSSPSSAASLFNMEYLDSIEVINTRKNGHHYAFRRIDRNRFMNYLTTNGYVIHNHSIFKVGGQAAPIGGAFIPSNATMVNGNTLVSRFEKDAMLSIANKFHLNGYIKKSLYSAYYDNEKLYRLTWDIAGTPGKSPKVIYTHLLMPHHPYYFKEDGSPRSFDELKNMQMEDEDAYLSYLKYTNKRMLQLVDQLIKASDKPPIIALVSDHGYRYGNKNLPHHVFSDLLSVYLPGKNYSQFKDTMTNVNFLRVLLNSQFNQRMPLLADTSINVDF